MKHSSLLVAKATIILSIVAGVAMGQVNDQVNVYFDANASVYDLPDVTFPAMIDAYLVLDSPSDTAGIFGWELTLSSDPNLTLVAGSVIDQNINVSSFPDFMVGYADTVAPFAGKIVLATFSVFAVGPGRIYINENAGSGFPGMLTPVYLPCANIDAPRALEVRQNLYCPSQ